MEEPDLVVEDLREFFRLLRITAWAHKTTVKIGTP